MKFKSTIFALAVVIVAAISVGVRNFTAQKETSNLSKPEEQKESTRLSAEHVDDIQHPSKTSRPGSSANSTPELQPPINEGTQWRPLEETLQWLEPENLETTRRSLVLDQIEKEVSAFERSQTVRTSSTRHFGKKRLIRTKKDSVLRLLEGMNFRAGAVPRRGFETAQYFIFSTPIGPNKGDFDSGYAVRKQDAEILVWKLGEEAS